MPLRLLLVTALGMLAMTGCARAPSPLAPHFGGSIGMPHRGVLTGSAELPDAGEGFRRLRQNDRNRGLPRFVEAIERAAAKVAAERPGSVLRIGDLSRKDGGQLLPHLSHRTGRDADLLLYLTTLEGAPVESPGFIHVQRDGLAWDDVGHRFLRFDVERTWLLVKTLLEDPAARVQWVFANRNVKALLIEWARARGESGELVSRANEVMLEPHPGGAHDDHVHVRTACAPDEIVAGCEPTGPTRAWIEAIDRENAPGLPSDLELAFALAAPIGKSSSSDARATLR